MKLNLLFLALFASLSCFGSSREYVDMLAALNNRSVKIQSTSQGGLGNHNLAITIQNLKRDTSYIKIPPGLHFKAEYTDDQDLFTVSEVLLVLAPQKQAKVLLHGFCMQAPKHSPRIQGLYTLQGYADPSLKGLADQLYKYEPLTQHYGQMFVWAITDNRKMYEVSVDSSLIEPAKAVVAYVANITKQDLVQVKLASKLNAAPSLEVFSKKGVLAFHNPVDQVATFKMYDAAGNELHTFYSNRKLSRGIKVHEFGTNDMIPVGSNPVYHYKVTNAAGKVLAQTQVDRTTEAREVNPEVINFNFEYKLEKPVQEARLRIYLQDGTLLEEFKRYTNLAPGGYIISMRFMHLYPAETTFVAKLESPDGSVHKEQLVSRDR